MPIFSVGLSHRTAPVDVREAVAVGEADLPTFLLRLRHEAALHEVAVLSTCNRLEIYALAPSVSAGAQAIRRWLAAWSGLDATTLDSHLYTLTGSAAGAHLLSVAAGLDSMILGEPQILGQVSQALDVAQTAGTLASVLTRLFTTAIRTGKRARAETAISRHTTSTSHAAVLLANAHVPNLTQARVLVVGAGEMAQLAIKALRRARRRADRLYQPHL